MLGARRTFAPGLRAAESSRRKRGLTVHDRPPEPGYPQTRRAALVNAGHPAGRLAGPGGLTRLEPTGPPPVSCPTAVGSGDARRASISHRSALTRWGRPRPSGRRRPGRYHRRPCPRLATDSPGAVCTAIRETGATRGRVPTRPARRSHRGRLVCQESAVTERLRRWLGPALVVGLFVAALAASTTSSLHTAWTRSWRLSAQTARTASRSDCC